MIRSLWIAKTCLDAQQTQLDVISNNLANVGTTGFRADLARFTAKPIEGPGYPSRINTVASGLGFDRKQGMLVETGNALAVEVIRAAEITAATDRPDHGCRIEGQRLLDLVE